MKLMRIRVDRYRHSATSKFVVTWCTGRRPSKLKIRAWELEYPRAAAEDRQRFLRGTWKRHRRFFRKKEEAETFANAQRTKLVNEGQRGLALADDIRLQAARCAERLKPFGYSIEEAVDYFIEYVQTTRRSVTVADLVPEYIKAKRQKGNKERSLKDISQRLKIFAQSFGQRNVATTSVAEIDDWLTGLGLSAQSQNNYRAVVRAFFEYAVKRDYTKANPVAKIDKVKIVDKPAAILTPDELRRLLDATSSETLPVLAIGAFAGLRMAEIFRLDWKEVDLVRGFIEVKASKSKTAQRRLVTILSPLREWLLPVSKREGPVWRWSEAMWRVRAEPVRRAAKLTIWPENGLRHSFGSYHLAKFNNANALALEMGHTTTKEIFAHYRQVVRPEEAERYWNIKPSAVTNVLPMESVVL